MTPNRTSTIAGLPRTIVALIAFLITGIVASGGAALAQDATPIESGGAVGTSVPCGERLGIGDATVACLTIVHAAADAGPVDVSVDGTILLTGVATATSTGFIALPANTYDVTVTVTGRAESVLVDLPDQSLDAGIGVEVAVVGSRDDSTLVALVLPIDPVVPTAGDASVRVVQTIPDAPPLDIGLGSGETLIPGLVPLTASDYLTAPAAATSIVVRPAGGADVLFPVTDFTPPIGGTLTIYAIGTVTNPTGITLLTVVVPGAATDGPGTPIAATPAI